MSLKLERRTLIPKEMRNQEELGQEMHFGHLIKYLSVTYVEVLFIFILIFRIEYGIRKFKIKGNHNN